MFTVMYQLKYTNRFKKDVKRAVKRGYDLSLLENVISLLQKTGKLPPKYKSHNLLGDYVGKKECHITSDWLLIWEQDDNSLTLLMLSTGTHSDLF